MFKVKKGLVPLGAGLVVTALLTGCAGQQLSWRQDASAPASSASATSSPTPSQKADESKTATKQATVVAPSILDNWAYPEEYLAIANKFGYGTTPYDNKTKKDNQKFPTFKIGSIRTSQTIWPDSVRPPLTEKSRDEIVARTLAEPDYCAMNAVGLYNTSIVSPSGEIISFKANNPWLSEWFPTDASGINDWAAHAMSGSPLEQLRTAKKCALVGTLLYQFKDNGVQNNLVTSLNYHIANADSATVNASNPVKTIREFELNPMQYTGEFEVLEFQLKGWPSKCENQILFNTGDGRFARPNCTPTPPPPTVVTPPKSTPPSKSTSCVKPAGGTKYWDFVLGKYICKDAYTDNPNYQGHIKPGTDGVAPVQTDKQGAPAGGSPPATYTVPSTLPVVGPPTGSTPGGDTGGAPQGGGGVQ
jgi:hypothetical protein